METANSKRRGVLKRKVLKPLSRLADWFPPAHGGGIKAKPSPPPDQDGPDEYYSTAWRSMSGGLSSMPPVRIGSVAKADLVVGTSTGYAQQSSCHGDDEDVDLKAASYIYNVRQRFRSLEGLGSDQAYNLETL